MAWTPELDLELTRLRGGGRSFGEISKLMGVSRSAALGRFSRLSGKVFPSRQVPRDVRNRLRAERQAWQQRALANLRTEIAAGRDRNCAIREAYRAGASQTKIGKIVGLSPTRVHNITAAPVVAINIPADLHRRIKASCAAEGVSVGDLLREMLETRFPAKP